MKYQLEDLKIINLFKKYIKVIGEEENKTLVFENISIKRNKEDFKTIENWLKRS